MDEKNLSLHDLGQLERDQAFRQHLPTPIEALSAPLRGRSCRRLIALLCLLCAAFVFLRQALLPSRTLSPKPEEFVHGVADTTSGYQNGGLEGSSNDQKEGNVYAKVPLEAHIMSKCPDARLCLQELVVPSMEKISDKVDFQLSFIGKLDPGSDAVECMHGPSECLGNIILLCAERLYPSAILHLGFANCMIGDYTKIPDRDFVEQCALEHGLDFQKINQCASDELDSGAQILRDSVTRSAKAGAAKSCTVRVGGDEWCIIDGGQFKGCKDGKEGISSLVDEVQTRWDKLNDAE